MVVGWGEGRRGAAGWARRGSGGGDGRWSIVFVLVVVVVVVVSSFACGVCASIGRVRSDVRHREELRRASTFGCGVHSTRKANAAEPRKRIRLLPVDCGCGSGFMAACLCIGREKGKCRTITSCLSGPIHPHSTSTPHATKHKHKQ